jgi:ferric-dicitrate binding protein FerR (iron transport regulator)
MSEPNNIGQPTGGHRKHVLPEDQLLAYLEGRLPADEQHQVEQWLANEGMESDALEGLHGLPVKDARSTVAHLNHLLQKTIKHKKRKRRQLADNKWAWLTIIIILLLAVLGYLVIKLGLKL